MNVECTMEFIWKAQAKAEVEMATMREQQARYETKARKEMDAIRTLIRAGMKMIAQNSEAIKEVAVAQKATEAELRTFINSLRRGGNGHSRKN